MVKWNGVRAFLGVLAIVTLAVAGCGGGGGGGNGGGAVVRGGIPYFPLVTTKQLIYTGGPTNPGQTTTRTTGETAVKNGRNVFVMTVLLNGATVNTMYWTVQNNTVLLVGENLGAGDVFYNPVPAGPGVYVVMTPPAGSYPAWHQTINATDGTVYTVDTTTVNGLTITVPAGTFTNVMKVRQVWTSISGTEIRLLWLASDPVREVGIVQAGYEDPISHAEVITSRLSSVTSP
jgi:hypothetical protein